jgi:hypothetical protein
MYKMKWKFVELVVFFVADFLYNMYPPLMGSKTPTSKFSESKEVRWGINCP